MPRFTLPSKKEKRTPLLPPTGSESSPPQAPTGSEPSPPQAPTGSESSPPQAPTGSESSPPEEKKDLSYKIFNKKGVKSFVNNLNNLIDSVNINTSDQTNESFNNIEKLL